MKKIAIFLLITTYAFSYVGKVAALKGDATIVRDNHSIHAKLGMDIDEKDDIKTKNALLQILFKDKTMITIGKNSEFSIQNYLFDNKNADMNFNLKRGFIKTITGKISKIAPNRFKIKTKNAIIGIRGTIFTVEYQNDITTLETINGLTTLMDLDTGKLIEVKQGTKATLNPKTKTRIIIKQVQKTIKVNNVVPIKTPNTSDITKELNNINKNTTVKAINTIIQDNLDNFPKPKPPVIPEPTDEPQYDEENYNETNYWLLKFSIIFRGVKL